MTTETIAYATDHLRTHDFEWYAALQFAPADKRPALIALFAYLAEVARVRSLVSEPKPGEIRLQWWRDTLSGTAHGAIDANPLAAALLQAIDDHALPAAPLLAVLDARTFDLYDDAMPSTADYEGYAGEIWSGPMSLAASVLSGDSPAHFADVAGHGGVALGVARTLVGFSQWAGRGQCYLPADLMQAHSLDRDMFAQRRITPPLTNTLRTFASFGLDHLEKARVAATEVEPSANAIWLPLALTRQTLEDVTSWSLNPFVRPLARPRWQKLFRLWRASKRSRVF
ncbi:MAG: phytoene/squalene synthase family protein [Hyphomicrobiales bacterium]